MKEWLSVQEILAENLPGIPTSQRGLSGLAVREEWNSRSHHARVRAGRGGGMEYHYHILPALAQVTYAHRNMGIVGSTGNQPIDPDLSNNDLTERAQIERDARVAIVRAFESYAEGLGALNLASKTQIFCDNYQGGRIAVEAWVKTAIPKFSKRTLLRWRASIAKGSINTLACDRGSSRKGTGLLDVANDGKVREFLLAHIAQQPLVAADRLRIYVRHEFGEQLIDAKGNPRPLPSLRSFQLTVKRYKQTENVLLTRLSNPDRYRSTMAPAGTNSLAHVTKPNAIWQIDASPLDAFDDSGKRPTLYACIDIATRRTVIYITKTPRADAVALLMRKAINKLGVPDAVKTDNGSDFVAEQSKRLFAALGIEVMLSNAYSPQEKGHVERVIRTIQSNLVEQLRAFVGHNVNDRKKLEDRVSFAKRLGAETAELFGDPFTMAEIQERADKWVDIHYDHAPHSSLDGQTPFDVAQASIGAIRTVPAQALDVLLMPVPSQNGYRTVTKMGVRVSQGHYQTFDTLPGHRVFVRMDPNDLGRILLFDADDGRFLEEAFNPELRGIDPATFHSYVKKRRNDLLKERSAPIAAEIKAITSGPASIDIYLEERAKDLAAKSNNVHALPKREIEHTTPELDAAKSAVSGESEPSQTQFETEFEAEPSQAAAIVPFKPKADAPGVRPAFRTDQDMAAWLIANPAQITERDRTHMNGLLKRWVFRELLVGCGTDPDELRAVLSQAQPKEEAKQ